MLKKLAPFLLLVALTAVAHAQTQPSITGTPEPVQKTAEIGSAPAAPGGADATSPDD